MDPGEDPPDGQSTGPPIPVFEDLGNGPAKGESLATYRKKVCARIARIAKEEEVLAKLKLDFKQKKFASDRLHSSKRRQVRPELMALEAKVEKQSLLVATLKETSGAFKEKYGNDDRFRAMRRGAIESSGGQASPECEKPRSVQSKKVSVGSDCVSGQHAGKSLHSKPSTSMPEDSGESSGTQAAGDQQSGVLSGSMSSGQESSVPLPPQQEAMEQDDPSEPVKGAGMMNFITEMESPLHGRKFAVSG